MDHVCLYCSQHRKVGTKYSAKTIVTQTTWICVQACEMCGETRPKTPRDDFITIRSNYSCNLIMGYKCVEEGDVCTERLPTFDWINFIPLNREDDSLYIRISKIKETNCQCKSCNFLKRNVDFIDDQR